MTELFPNVIIPTIQNIRPSIKNSKTVSNRNRKAQSAWGLILAFWKGIYYWNRPSTSGDIAAGNSIERGQLRASPWELPRTIFSIDCGAFYSVNFTTERATVVRSLATCTKQLQRLAIFLTGG